MNGTALATALLGRRVRLANAPAEAQTKEGTIVTVYLDAHEVHYVVLVGQRLVNVATADDFTVLEDSDW